MHIIRLTLILLTTLWGSLQLDAAANPVDSLNHALAKTTSAADSIRILYNLYDLSSRRQAFELAAQIHDVAKRSGDIKTQSDMLRHLSNLYLSNDSLQATFEAEALKLPPSAEQRETVTFIRMQRVSSGANYGTEEARIKQLRKLLAQNESTPANADLYTRIVNLFSVCAYLGQISKGELLVTYLEELEKLISQLPYQLYAIRNCFYTQAAILYTYAGDPKRAIEADKELLRLIDMLEANYHAQGRKYRKYDFNRYICYRRILTNFRDMPTHDVDHYYKLAMDLGENNPELMADIEAHPRPQISYLMKHERYDEAIPLLQKQIATEAKPRERRFYLSMLKEAATKTGNNELLLAGALDYNNLLEDYIELKSAESYRELQIRYELDKLSSANEELERKQDEATQTAHLWLIACAGLIVVMLLVIIALISMNNRKFRRLSHNLQQSNDALKAERENLIQAKEQLTSARDRALRAERLRDDFVGKISHEIVTPVEVIDEYSTVIFNCIDDDKKKYLEKFVSVVKLNCELLKNLIFDVLGLSQYDNSKALVHIEPTSVEKMCREALEGVETQIKPGVELKFNTSDTPDLEITVDAHRVVKVLDNLLSNAAKFTREGSITLDYNLVDNGENIQFSVTDTGIGIPKEKAELIFERFKQLTSQTQGIGLGLPTCRMLATLMKGEVKLDTSYRGGARFLFTLPVNI